MKKAQVLEDKMTLNKFWGIWNFVEAGIILIAGVLAIVMGFLYGSDSSNDFQNAITTITYNVLPFLVGGFVIMDAILRLVLSITKTNHESDESILLIGGFELTAGILLMIFHGIFTDFIIHAIGVLMIVIGVIFLVFSVLSIAQKRKKLFVPILEIVFASVLVAVGVAIEIIYGVSNAGTRTRLVLIIAGFIFAIVAIAQIVITAITLHKAKKEDKVFADVEIIDPNKRAGSSEAFQETKQSEIIDVDANESHPELTGGDPKAIEHKDEK